jgi:hypothetical protein
MKKIILALAVLFAFAGVQKATAQDQRVKFYYYPSNNVYYDVSGNQYWYYDEPTVKWMEVKTLPTTITLQKTPVYTVYYNGSDVWKDNDKHKAKYKGNKSDPKKNE